MGLSATRPGVLLVAFTLTGCSGRSPSAPPGLSTPPRPPAHVGGTAAARRPAFAVRQTTWSAADTLTGHAELAYSGLGERLLYGASAGLVGFTWRQIGGTKHGGWFWQLDCSHRPSSAASPLSSPVRLLASWS